MSEAMPLWPYVGMPRVRRKRPSVAPGVIAGTDGMPGQNFWVSLSIAAASSGLITDGSLGGSRGTAVTVILGSASTFSISFWICSAVWVGTMRQLTIARASWG